MHDIWPPIHTSEVLLKIGDHFICGLKKEKKNFLKETKRKNEMKGLVGKKKSSSNTFHCHWFHLWKARIIRKQLNYEKIAMSFWSEICSKGFIKYHWVQRSIGLRWAICVKEIEACKITENVQERERADKDSRKE